VTRRYAELRRILWFFAYFVFYFVITLLLLWQVFRISLLFVTEESVTAKIGYVGLAFLLILFEGVLGYILVRLTSKLRQEANKRREEYDNRMGKRSKHP
jgi:hypothetical protein